MEQHFLDILEIEYLDNMVYQCFTTGGPRMFFTWSKFSFTIKKPKKKKQRKCHHFTRTHVREVNVHHFNQFSCRYY